MRQLGPSFGLAAEGCRLAILARRRALLETLAADVSERGATRMDDKTSEASMEKRKKDGYF